MKPSLTFVMSPDKELNLTKKEELKKEEQSSVPERKVKIEIVAKETLIEEEAMK